MLGGIARRAPYYGALAITQEALEVSVRTGASYTLDEVADCLCLKFKDSETFGQPPGSIVSGHEIEVRRH